MRGFLVDTDVVSERMRDEPNPRVVAFCFRDDDL